MPGRQKIVLPVTSKPSLMSSISTFIRAAPSSSLGAIFPQLTLGDSALTEARVAGAAGLDFDIFKVRILPIYFGLLNCLISILSSVLLSGFVQTRTNPERGRERRSSSARSNVMGSKTSSVVEGPARGARVSVHLCHSTVNALFGGHPYKVSSRSGAVQSTAKRPVGGAERTVRLRPSVFPSSIVGDLPVLCPVSVFDICLFHLIFGNTFGLLEYTLQ